MTVTATADQPTNLVLEDAEAAFADGDWADLRACLRVLATRRITGWRIAVYHRLLRNAAERGAL